MTTSLEGEPGRGARRPAWPWIAIGLAAFVLRVVVVRQYEAHHPHAELLVIDEAAYDAWALRIAAGEWLGDAVFFQEPLYPYLLGALYALLGPERLAVRLVQALLGALACVAVGKLAERLFGRKAGLLAGAGLAVYGPLLLQPCFLLKEAVFVPGVALFALLLVHARERGGPLAWCGLGALAGLGALLRGNVLVLLPLVALAPFVRPVAPPRWRASLAFLGGVALVLLPVLARNVRVGGAWVLTTSQAGTNLYAGNNAENEYGRAYEVGFVRGIPEHEAGDWAREAERRAGRALGAGEVSAFWRDATFASVRADPALHARILWNKLRLTLGAHEVPDNHAWSWDVLHVPFLRAPWPGFGVLGALGLAGLLRHGWKRLRGARPAGPADVVALLFLAYLATIVLTVTSDRARLPLVPLLAPFAAVLALETVAAARALAFRRAAALLALACASGAFVHWPVLPAHELQEDLDEREFNLAAARAADPARRADARAIVAGLVQRHPGSLRTRLLAAELELAAARAAAREPDRNARAAAAQRLAELAALLEELGTRGSTPRERRRLDALLGEVALARGEPEEALRSLRAALAFDPDDARLRLMLAHAHLAAAERAAGDAALEELRAAEEALVELRARANDALGPAVELAWAQAAFLRGRMLLAAGDEPAASAGRAAVQAALRALQPLAERRDLAPSTRAEVRRLAGRIQLAIGSDAALASAENHFRAALALEDEPEALLGLAQTLVTRAERSAGPSEARLGEARALAERLAEVDARNPALAELRARLERATTTAPR